MPLDEKTTGVAFEPELPRRKGKARTWAEGLAEGHAIHDRLAKGDYLTPKAFCRELVERLKETSDSLGVGKGQEDRRHFAESFLTGALSVTDLLQYQVKDGVEISWRIFRLLPSQSADAAAGALLAAILRKVEERGEQPAA